MFITTPQPPIQQTQFDSNPGGGYIPLAELRADLLVSETGTAYTLPSPRGSPHTACHDCAPAADGFLSQ